LRRNLYETSISVRGFEPPNATTCDRQ